MSDRPSPASVVQEQFLTVLSREEALARFEAALFPRGIVPETRRPAEALGLALAENVVAPVDVPPFDRANVDGFAVRSADIGNASEANPVLRPFAEAGMLPFALAKGATFLPALAAAEWYRRRRPEFVLPLLRGAAILYTAIYTGCVARQFWG